MPSFLHPCSRRIDCRCLECRTSRHTPTPEEIADACERIRATWSPLEHRTRIVDGATARIASGRQPVQVVHMLPVDEAVE